MTTNEELIAEASRLIADCMTYNFGMHNADKLAHEANKLSKTGYGQYLLRILKERPAA